MVLTHTLDETYAVAADFVKEIKGKKRATAVVVALYGELGSGKTSFVQGIAKALGITETIISPTFILLKKYKRPDLKEQGGKRSGFGELIHIDLYRIEDEKELLHFRFDELMKDPKNIICIEWAEKAETLLPKDTIRIYFKHVSEDEREIMISEKRKAT